jgi:small subunit ribosomal protein S4e
MAGKHEKRLAAPRAIQLHRKEKKWSYKASPGPHPHERSIPLAMVVRDYLKLCDTGREARKIIGAGAVLIDGKKEKNHKHPVGLMDVVQVPATKQSFRVLLDRHARLQLVTIPEAEARWKLTRVQNKTTVPGGKIQLNLHDGRNILVPKTEYKTGDVLKLEVPTQKVLGAHKLTPGNLGLVTNGAHAGTIATIKGVEVKKGPYPNIVVFGRDEGEFRTIKDYVFPVGEKAADVKLPEVAA